MFIYIPRHMALGLMALHGIGLTLFAQPFTGCMYFLGAQKMLLKIIMPVKPVP